MYFFKGRLERGKIRIYPVAGQKFPSGLEVNEDFKVKCPKHLRTSDLFTVYASRNLNIIKNIIQQSDFSLFLLILRIWKNIKN